MVLTLLQWDNFVTNLHANIMQLCSSSCVGSLVSEHKNLIVLTTKIFLSLANTAYKFLWRGYDATFSFNRLGSLPMYNKNKAIGFKEGNSVAILGHSLGQKKHSLDEYTHVSLCINKHISIKVS